MPRSTWNCSAVSTPSATVLRPIARAMSTTARATAKSTGSSATSVTNARSTLTVCAGSSLSRASEE